MTGLNAAVLLCTLCLQFALGSGLREGTVQGLTQTDAVDREQEIPAVWARRISKELTDLARDVRANSDALSLIANALPARRTAGQDAAAHAIEASGVNIASSSTASAQKPRLAYILRGFLVREGWKPKSGVGRAQAGPNGYTQDIRPRWSGHQRLIEALGQRYDVEVLFFAYDDTPPSLVEWAKAKGTVMLFPFDVQFHLVGRGLDRMKNDAHASFDFYVIARTDFTLCDAFVQFVAGFDFTDEERIYVLSKEESGIVNDAWWGFSSRLSGRMTSFFNWASSTAQGLFQSRLKEWQKGSDKPAVQVVLPGRIKFLRDCNPYYAVQGMSCRDLQMCSSI